MSEVQSIPPLSGVKDQATRAVLQALVNGWRVRNGDIGNGDRRFLTAADLPGEINRAVSSGRTVLSGGGYSAGSPGSSAAVRQLIDAVLSSAIITSLRSDVARISSPAWVDDVLGNSEYLSDLAAGITASVDDINSAIDAINASVADILNTPAYDNAETYDAGEMVTYGGGLYRATQSTTGNLPTDTAYWEKIGDYASLSDAVAALTASVNDHESRIGDTEDGLYAEIAARSTLATQLTGGYTGTDPNSLASGLIYQERVARATADASMASTLTALSATVNSNNTAVNARISTEETARASADTALSNTLSTLQATVTGNDTDVRALIAAESEARAAEDEALAETTNLLQAEAEWQQQWNDIWNAGLGVNDAASTVYTSATVLTEQTARISADSAEAALRVTLEAKVDTNDSQVRALVTEEATARATADAAEATARTLLGATLETSIGAVSALVASESTARANGDNALATQIDALEVSIAGNAAAIIAEQTARADAVSAVASAVTQLQTGVGGQATAEDALALAQTTEGVVSASWSVKFSVDGYVTGAGLGLEGKGGSYSSTFGVLADNFMIAGPSVGGYVTGEPFIYRSTPYTVGAVTMPPGLYLKNAFIDYISAGQIDTRGLTVRDASGNIILSSGVSLDWSRVGGAGRPADNATANPVVSQASEPSPRTTGMFWYNSGSGTINGVPAKSVAQWNGSSWVVVANNVTTSTQLSDSGNIQNGNIYISSGYLYGIGYGNGTAVANANIYIGSNGALIGAGGGQVTLSGLGAGLMAWLNQITSGNIGTYIQSAAIGTAYIGDLAVTTLKLADGAVTVSSAAEWAYGTQFYCPSPFGTYQEVLSVTFNLTAAARCAILGYAVASTTGSDMNEWPGDCTIWIDGVQRYFRAAAATAETLMYGAYLAAGWHTVSLRIRPMYSGCIYMYGGFLQVFSHMK